MAGYERVVTESPDRESASRADEYTRNFLQDEALPTIWQELAFHRRFVPGITLAEVNALAKRLVPRSEPAGDRVGAGSGRRRAARPSRSSPPRSRRRSDKKLDAYVDAAGGEPLMDAPPAAGTIVKTTPRPEAGITEWTLSNGATVVLKPTTLKEDQILFRATAPGGTSLASDADFIPARVADDVVPAGGVGKFSDVDARQACSSARPSRVRPFIGEIEPGDGGRQHAAGSRDDVPARSTCGSRSRAPIRPRSPRWPAQARGLLANQLASPDVVFNQAIDAALSGNSPRRQPETPATVEQWDLAKSLAFYKARFADASNFTFVFVGSFTPESIKPLVETYIASLPATHAQRDLARSRHRAADGRGREDDPEGHRARRARWRSSSRDRSPTTSAPAGASGDDAGAAVAAVRHDPPGARRHLQHRGPPEARKAPKPEYTVRIDWTCDPAQTASLVQRVFDEIEFVQAHDLSARTGERASAMRCAASSSGTARTTATCSTRSRDATRTARPPTSRRSSTSRTASRR